MTRDIPALIAFLDARSAMPFAWGRRANDCVSYAVGAIHAQTGRWVLPASRFGTWTTERGAMRLIVRHGGLEAMVGKVLASMPPALAMRGDIAGVPDPVLGIALMVVEGATLVAPGDAGNARLPRAAMTLAWSAVELPSG